MTRHARPFMLLLAMLALIASMTGCGESLPGFRPSHVGAWESRQGPTRTVIELDANGSGSLYSIRSVSSGANERKIHWASVDGVINLHADLGRGQRAAMPFQKFKLDDGVLVSLDLTTGQPTSRTFRKISGVTGLAAAR